MIGKQPNSLIHEKSPYLLQHAHNPVDWHPWSEKIINEAQKSNKLLIISIGYATCHWCHVMEKENFEDQEVADIMNAHFISIKVDREERPDIDHMYMDAIQLMGKQGGWPLNVVALPDGTPVFGGTYFPKEAWMDILLQLVQLKKEQPEKLIEFGNKIRKGLQSNEIVFSNSEQKELPKNLLIKTVSHWLTLADKRYGGIGSAPKFPMPTNYLFLLNYLCKTNNNELSNFTENTLVQMAHGGIYDQLNGGFYRYSVDSQWYVPHFEKMLYDNAQLIELYSNAFIYDSKEIYSKVLLESIHFLTTSLKDEKSGLFYSGIDADSEGEEGKYYTWSEKELNELYSSKDRTLIDNYFLLNKNNLWENKFILRLNDDYSKFTNDITHLIPQLRNAQEERSFPAIDDKLLCSWNAMVVNGLVNAYYALNDEEYLTLAQSTLDNLLSYFYEDKRGLFHSSTNKNIQLLEDYAFTIKALLSVLEISNNEKYYQIATQLTERSLDLFYDEKDGFFWFSDKSDKYVSARKKEIMDNVIPSTNSVMAHNLFRLGKISGNNRYLSISEKMTFQVAGGIEKAGPWMSNWANLVLLIQERNMEVAVLGENYKEIVSELKRSNGVDLIVVGGNKDMDIPLLKNRFVKEKNLIYVCKNNSCQFPVENTQEAIKLIQR